MAVEISGQSGVVLYQANTQASLFKYISAGAALPDSNIGPVWSDDYASVLVWRTVGGYTGYFSVNIGQVIYVESEQAPPGYLISNGTTLSGSPYEQLIAFRGSSVLLDLRGEFIRGLDAGRGIDINRLLGTSQADELKSHTHQAYNQNTQTYAVPPGSFYGLISWDGGNTRATSATGGGETRPRNVALLPCIKY